MPTRAQTAPAAQLTWTFNDFQSCCEGQCRSSCGLSPILIIIIIASAVVVVSVPTICAIIGVCCAVGPCKKKSPTVQPQAGNPQILSVVNTIPAGYPAQQPGYAVQYVTHPWPQPPPPPLPGPAVVSIPADAAKIVSP